MKDFDVHAQSCVQNDTLGFLGYLKVSFSIFHRALPAFINPTTFWVETGNDVIHENIVFFHLHQSVHKGENLLLHLSLLH
jgi:hypothetical protein